jgi:hypothetical protein
MDEKQKASWRRARAKGQLRYALLYGGVVWGLPLGLLFVAVDLVFRLIDKRSIVSLIASAPFGRYIFQVAFFYLSGLVLGLLMWSRYEREYSKSV